MKLMAPVRDSLPGLTFPGPETARKVQGMGSPGGVKTATWPGKEDLKSHWTALGGDLGGCPG